MLTNFTNVKDTKKHINTYHGNPKTALDTKQSINCACLVSPMWFVDSWLPDSPHCRHLKMWKTLAWFITSSFPPLHWWSEVPLRLSRMKHELKRTEISVLAAKQEDSPTFSIQSRVLRQNTWPGWFILFIAVLNGFNGNIFQFHVGSKWTKPENRKL